MNALSGSQRALANALNDAITAEHAANDDVSVSDVVSVLGFLMEMYEGRVCLMAHDELSTEMEAEAEDPAEAWKKGGGA